MKKSVRAQIVLAFIGMAGFILLFEILANTFFLPLHYTNKAKDSLVDVYTMLNTMFSGDVDDFNSARDEFYTRSNNSNISTVVVTSDFKLVLATNVHMGSNMAAKLFAYMVGFDDSMYGGPEDFETEDGMSENSDDGAPAAGAVSGNTDRSGNRNRLIATTDHYTIQEKSDNMEDETFLEMYGTLDSGYQFLMRIPVDNISANIQTSNEFTVVAALIAVLIGVGLATAFSKRLTAPIRKLTSVSEQMADLDFSVRYTGNDQDEIGQLGQSFNRMADSLQEAFEELQKANEQLQKDVEIKTKNEMAMRTFVGDVSHELKTPIALIQGYAEAIRDLVEDGDTESMSAYNDIILDEAHKMDKLVRQLIELTKLESGTEELDREPVDLVRIVEEEMSRFAYQASEIPATMKREGTDREVIMADGMKIDTMITNFLNNALKHVKENGQVIVSVEPDAENQHVKVSVYNDGDPISDEDLPHLWDRFYKADKARTRSKGGTGIGLSIVKAIIDAHEGTYGAENVDGGVVFWASLPVGQVPEDEGAAQ